MLRAARARQYGDEHRRRNRFRSQPGGDLLGNRLPDGDMAADLFAYFGEISARWLS